MANEIRAEVSVPFLTFFLGFFLVFFFSSIVLIHSNKLFINNYYSKFFASTDFSGNRSLYNLLFPKRGFESTLI